MKLETLEIFVIVMFFISFYGLITSKNAVKSIVFIALMEISVIMFFLCIGYGRGLLPPIGGNTENTADPLPQALMITAIIIGVAVTAVNLTMVISLCRQSKATDWDIIQKKNME